MDGKEKRHRSFNKTDMISLIQSIKKVRTVMNKKAMSPTVRSILEQEENNGARVANLFRYVIALLFAFPLFSNVTDTSTLVTNLIFFALYLGITIGHTVILRNEFRTFKLAFDYLVIIYDYFLITGMMVYYSLSVSPDNFAHAIKNPLFLYYLVPLATTALQFRPRLLFVAITTMFLFYGWMILYGLTHGMKLTNDWLRYILGPDVVLSDILTKPIPLVCLALILAYVAYRAMYMIQRIGDVESQRASLARYFSPDVVEELSSSHSSLGPGVRQKVTILFSDIRNFTKMSERMQPDELASFLTDFRNRMTTAIFQNGGTIDKFVGDAIMATFGTPRPSATAGLDTKNALRAGVAMMRALTMLNDERAIAKQNPIGIGIGIHTGEVFSGTIGSEGMVEYTVIGDAVNTASRIESLCKLLKTDFLISSQVASEIEGMVPVEKMRQVKVKGKEQPLQVYRVAWAKPN
jgi:adenylate cyclase